MGGAGNDLMDGGEGINTVSFAGTTSNVSADLSTGSASGSGSGFDLFRSFTNVIGGSAHDVITGNASDNVLNGGTGHDQLIGGAGNDTLVGSSGHDMAIYAGLESDYFLLFGGLTPFIYDLRSGAPDGVDALDGIETIRFANSVVSLTPSTFASSYVNLGQANPPALSWAAIDMNGEAPGSFFSATLIVLPNDDGTLTKLYGTGMTLDPNTGMPIAGTVSKIERTSGDGATVYESFNGLATPLASFADGNFYRIVTAGNDILFGSFGNDTLVGGGGGGTFIGGTGTNTVSYANAQQATSGTGGVFADLGTASNNNTANTPATNSQDAVGDTYSDISNLIGSAYDDTLRGTSGNNLLTGGDGNDVLRGRGGNDTLDGGNGTDFADYSDETAAITVDLQTPGSNVGAPALDTFSSIEGVIAGTGNDTLRGDNNTNFLRGGVGADTLDGRGGNDYADYRNATGGLTVDLAAQANNTGEAAGDTFTSIEGIRGSQQADLLRGDSNANFLRGGQGADTLEGGGGTDTAEYNNAGSGVTADLGNSLNNTGEAAGDTYSSIENLRGSFFGDTLRGDANANRLRGDSGNDTLDGGAGSDTAQFSGLQADYSITYNANGTVTIQDLRQGLTTDGTDTLSNIEFAQFLGSGTTVALTGPSNQPPTGVFLSANHVAENSAAGTFVGLLTATDPNPGDTFTFTLNNPALSAFEIVNGNQLVVKAGANLDFESQTFQNVNVTVDDGHGGQFTQNLTVLVDNVVELPTGVTLTGGIALNEGLFSSSILGTLSPMGGDIGAPLIWSIVSDPTSSFDVSGNQLRLASFSTFDYEQISSYTIQLVAELSSTNEQSAPLTLTLNVIDQNPEINFGEPFDQRLVGGAGNDTFYGGSGGFDTFEGGAGNDSLIVEQTSGSLTISGGEGSDYLRDYSQNGTWNTDLGSGDDTADIVADGGVRTLTLGAGRDTIIAGSMDVPALNVVNVTDFATGLGGDVIDLTGFASGSVLLVQSGADTLVRYLYQMAPEQLVTPIDLARLQGVTATTLTQDNFQGFVPPVYTPPPPNQPPSISIVPVYTTLPDSTSVDSVNGLKVADIIVSDPDGGTVNLGLTGADVSLFEIRTASGTHELIFRGALDASVNPSLDVTVTADDPSLGASGVIEASAPVHIDVTHINHAPSVTPVTSPMVMENTASGFVVTNLFASDPDMGDIVFTFNLVDDAGGRFQIVNGNQLSTGATNIDFEATGPSINVTVTATDSHGATSAPQTITVNVMDLPDTNHAPTMVFVNGAASVMENSGAGMPIATLQAMDPDPTDSQFTFNLIDNAGGRIQIVNGNQLATGPVNIDYEALANGTLTVTVTATDSRGATSAPQQLVINVMNMSPEFHMGTMGSDTLTGSGDSDDFYAQDGNDLLIGMGGNDRFEGNAGADTLDGGTGYDTATYGDSSDPMTIYLDGRAGVGGTAEGDVLIGIEEVQAGGGADLVVGNDFDNRLQGNGGSDTLLGNGGNDTFEGIYGDIVIDGGSGVDRVNIPGMGGAPATIAANGAGGWTVTTHRFGPPTYTEDIVETQTLSNVEVVDLAPGQTKLLVGNGGFATAADAQAWAAANGVTAYEVLTAGAGGGGGGNASLLGGPGDDVLVPGASTTFIDGNLGTDKLALDASGQTGPLYLSGSDFGNYHVGSAGANVTYYNVESFDVTGTGTGDYVDLAIAGSATLRGGDGNDTLHAGSGNDSLAGGDGNDAIWGGSGDDSLDGGAGDDSFDSMFGNDTVEGGAGTDTIAYFGLYGGAGWALSLASDGSVTIDSTHTLSSPGSYGIDTLTGIEQVANVTVLYELVTGTSGGDTLVGGPGSEIILGGAGDDVLIGGENSLSVNVDVQMLFGGDGVDTAVAAGGLYSGNGYRLYLLDDGSIEIDSSGTSHAGEGVTYLYDVEKAEFGSSAYNLIVGRSDSATPDNLVGTAADDLILGGKGSDSIDGGAGVDQAFVYAGEPQTIGISANENGGWTVTTQVSVPFGSGNFVNETRTLTNIEVVNANVMGVQSIKLLVGKGGFATAADAQAWAAANNVTAYDILTAPVTNQAPVAVDDDIRPATGSNTDAHTAIQIVRATLTANDFDPNGTPINSAAYDHALTSAFGATISSPGSTVFVYDPTTSAFLQSVASNQTVTDTFTYRVWDGELISNYATVTLSVQGLGAIIGTPFDDVLTGSAGNDTIVGLGGNDTINGGDGVDTAVYSQAITGMEGEFGPVALNADGSLTVNLYHPMVIGPDEGIDTLIGIERISFAGTTYDLVVGTIDPDNLIGSAGNDIFVGSNGEDTFTGGAGNDILIGGAPFSMGTFQPDGDRAVYAGGLLDGGGYALEINANGTLTVDALGTTHPDEGIDTLVGIGKIDFGGTVYNLVLGRSSGDAWGWMDSLTGTSGVDLILGGDGDDTIDGGAGNDAMAGGAGRDTISFASSTGSITVTLGDGDVLGTATGTLSGSDIFDDFEDVVGGSGNDNITGNNAGNRLDGGFGHDRLSGGGGNDTIVGGDGYDRAVYSGNAADYVYGWDPEVANFVVRDLRAGSPDGTDVIDGTVEQIRFNDRVIGINSSAGFNTAYTNFAQPNAPAIALMDLNINVGLPGLVATETEFTIEAEDGTLLRFTGTGFSYHPDYGFPTGGNVQMLERTSADGATVYESVVHMSVPLDMMMASSFAHNIAFAGRDILFGSSLDDTLYGGAGGDVFIGNGGFNVVTYADAQSPAGPFSSSTLGLLVDLTQPSINTGDAAGDTYTSISGVIGSDYDDTLRGGAANNILAGGDGNDVLMGRGGADTLDGGNGFDFADYANITLSGAAGGIVADLQNESVNTGEAAGDHYVSIEALIGGAGNDTLSGDDNTNFLRGNGGTDVLDGRGGIDYANYRGFVKPAGGTGPLLVDLANPANNTYQAAGDTFIGIEGIRGSLVESDVLRGDAGDNYLRGMGGADTLEGGEGSDWAEYANATTGIIADLGDETQNLGEATGDHYDSIENLRGGAFDDELRGDAGDNKLRGGDGDDTLSGGAGVDTAVYAGVSGDYDVFFNSDGTVTVRDDEGDEGEDLLTGIERIQFADGTIDATPPVFHDPVAGSATFAATEGQVLSVSAANGLQQAPLAQDEDVGDSLWLNEINGQLVFYGTTTDVITLTTGATLTVNRDGSFSYDPGTAFEFLAAGQVLANADSFTFVVQDTRGVSSNLGTITFDVTGVNDAPVNLTLTGATVAEASAFGTIVGALSASDVDTSDTLTFTLLDDAGGRFTVVGTSLVVDYGVGLDYEQATSHTVTVRADDGHGGIVDQTFEIAVTNVDPENVYGSMEADSIVGGALNDTIAGNGGNDTIAGGAGTDTAQLTGLQSEYVFSLNPDGSVTVSDIRASAPDGTDTLSGIEFAQFGNDALVDIGPAFFNQAPTRVDLSATSIREDAGPGTVIGTLSAIDPNATDTHVFEVVGTGSDRFEAVGNELRLKAGAVLDHETPPGSVQVTVRATDQYGGARDETFTITVSDAPEAPTSLTLDKTSVDENAAPGTAVGLLHATDPDIGSVFTFAISDDPTGSFAIQGNTLVISADAQLNYEAQSSYTIEVTVSDPTGLEFAQSFTITLNDLPEGAPTDILVAGGSVLENAAAGTVAATFTVVDPDGGPHTFSIVSGDTGLFTIAGNQLVVAAGAGIDYETATSHDLVIRATDADGNFYEEALTVAVDNVAPIWVGTSANETRTGSDEEDTLSGLGGNDTLSGGLGDDTLLGGAGNDTYVLGAGDEADAVVEVANEGIDVVQLAAGFTSAGYALTANVENLVAQGSSGYELTGNASSNAITGGAGNDRLDGGLGADSLAGGLGNDTYIVAAGDLVTEAAAAGTDEIQTGLATYSLAAVANVENLTFTGTGGFTGTGNSAGNVITGGDSADSLSGGAGADTMAGGEGADTYVVDNAADVVDEQGSDGGDLVQSSISYTLASGVENLTLTGTAGTAGTGNEAANVLTGNAGANLLDGRGGADTMAGGAGNDTYLVDDGDVVTELTSGGIDLIRTTLSSFDLQTTAEVENLVFTGAGDFTATGNAASNSITTGAGSDLLDGGLGNDTLTGGLGNDTYVVGSGDVVTEAAAAGTDEIRTALNTFSIAALANIENLTFTGSGGFTGTGNAAANSISGGNGADLLSGGAGADTMAGGEGADTYIVDSVGDSVVETGAGLGDEVQSAVSYTLADGIENLTLTGAATLSATGNAAANRITGNAAANLVDGGSGADTMIGGAGNDTYLVDDAGDVVTETGEVGSGVDTVQVAASAASVSYTVGDNIENVVVLSGAGVSISGNALANAMTGGTGNDRLDGGLGNDTLAGGLGDDTYVVGSGDVVTEAAGAGTDEIQTALNTFSLAVVANVENLTFTGAGNFTGTGNAAANALSGSTGSDLLSGGTGADTMAGGTGVDTYIVDNAGDVVIEMGSDLGDEVQSAITYTLSSGVENLVLSGTMGTSGFGSADANRITGNLGANLIDGGLGADTMTGGLGNDTYVVDDSGDVVVEAASGGTDQIRTTTASFDLGATPDVESLVFIGGGNFSGTGNALANAITGGAGNDRLDGGLGNDTLAGGLGNDTFVVGTGDVVTEAAGAGTDEIQTAINAFSLASLANVENLTFTGAGGFTATGNASSNVITGGAGADSISGGLGADTMIGGSGSDTYIVESAGDVITEIAGDTGTDLVSASVSYTLSDGVENLTLTGTAIAGTGNAGANLLTGTTLANVLDGGAGADTMIGGAGNDTYAVDTAGDVITELAGGGMDTLRTTLASFDLGTVAEVENLVFIGSGDVTGTGSALANAITSGSGADSLDGGAGNDTLTAGGGNDTLQGGLGNDSMVGGTGDDLYYVDSATDNTVENLAEGTDTVIASINTTLRANVENLVLAGAATSGTGNGLDNVITGTAAANTLSGSTGNDTLLGGGGADNLSGGAGNDRLVVSDALFAKVDGGTEQDVLTFDYAGILDLTGIANTAITGVEAIDITGAAGVANTLKIAFEDVRDFSTSSNLALAAAISGGASLLKPTDSIVVYGDAGDTVQLAASSGALAAGLWQKQAVSVSIAGELFDLYDFRLNGVVQGTIAVDSHVTVL